MRALVRHGFVLSVLLIAAAAPAAGQIKVVDRANTKVTLSGAIQPQFRLSTTPDAPASHEVIFRRLFTQAVVALAGDWAVDVQLDFGRSTFTVKNAYVQYAGWRDRGLRLTVGNQKPPFSRSFMTSGIKRSLAERPFTGDAHYGTLNRMLGAKLDGWTHDRHVQWSAAVGALAHPASAIQLAFDSPVAVDGTRTEGTVAVGRLEWHPYGATPAEQGDFHTPAWRAMVAVAGYRWWSGGRRDATAAADLGSSAGVELSGGLRGHGVSVDVEFEPLSARARADVAPGGLFVGRQARLRKGSIEGSYMVVNHRLELAAGVAALGAGAWTRAWRRTSIGANWLLHDRALELQMTYRRGANVAGRPGASQQETFVQMLLAF